MSDLKTLGDQVIQALRECVNKAMEVTAKRLNAFESRLEGIAKSIPDENAIAKRAATLAAESIPIPKDGKSVTVEEVMPLIVAEVAKIPKAADGKDGRDGKDGEAGAPGAQGAPGIAGEKGDPGVQGEKGDPGAPGEQGPKGDAGDPGKDGADGLDGAAGEKGADGLNGKSAYELAVEQGFKGSLLAWLDHLKGAPGAVGKDGAPGGRGDQGAAGRDGANGLDGVPGEKGEKGDTGAKGAQGDQGPAGRDGADGKDGRDAAHLEILPTIDEKKSYPRGTFSTFRGGLFRSFEATDGLRGWECIVDGIEDIEIKSITDREFSVVVKRASGKVTEASFKMPVVLDKGIYRESETYEKGDGTTWAGSFWIAQKDAPGKPGDGDGWRLTVKRGRDGKDAITGQPRANEPVRL